MICVIDACSYIYLNQHSFTIGGKDYTLFSLLDQLITIRQSETVGQEMLRHSNKIAYPEDDIKRNNRNYKFKRPLKDYDDLLFNSTINSSSNDAGEKANLAVCIDMLNLKNNRQIVFLSDDLKALEDDNNVKKIYDAFPYFPIWNSMDVILFIYYSDKHFNYNLAEQTLQDLISFHNKLSRIVLEAQRNREEIDNDAFSQKVEKLHKRQQKNKILYLGRLDKIRKIIKK